MKDAAVSLRFGTPSSAMVRLISGKLRNALSADMKNCAASPSRFIGFVPVCEISVISNQADPGGGLMRVCKIPAPMPKQVQVSTSQP